MDPPTMSETRDDEEQNVKYFETIELLLAAGYFRARIKGLSPFDKVVGGMTWCITTCDFDVDVDLLFQENSNIGQKIALTEKIVAVLPSMRCPHRIEPHQIQGLDFISIFPVIQWLVKRAIETREEMGDQIRSYSVTQFHKNYSLPEDLEYEHRKEKCLEAVLKCKDSYKPRRIYRKPSSFLRTDEETQVQSTLLEYGRRYGFSKSSKTEKEQTARQKALAASMAKAGSAEEDDYQKEEMRIKAIMEGMSEAGIKEMLSSRTVGSLVGLQSDKIVEISAAYAQQQARLEQETTELKAGRQAGAQTYSRLVTTLEKSIANEKAKLQEAVGELQSVTQALNLTKDEHEKKVQERQRLDEQMAGLDSLETEKNKSVLSQLRSLVALNESLKKQEQEFKAQCKDELAILQDKLNAVQSVNASEDSDEAMRVKLIVDQFDRDSEKLQKIRLLLAKKNREIASLQWKIDDVPSRAELAQYQRRFIELYNQVASTHKETKQFYTLYNTLDDTKLYLEKEVGLLNSIHDSFEQALSSSTSKDEFLQQLEKIVQGVLNNKSNVDKRRNQEKAKRDTLNSRLMDLVEKQRMYFKTVREFQEECKKSEMIQSKSRSD